MKNSVVKLGVRVSAFLSLLIASTQIMAKEITVLNDPFEVFIDTMQGSFGVLFIAAAVIFWAAKLIFKPDFAMAVRIIIAMVVIWKVMDIVFTFI